jgi:hypothetical protein
MEPSLEIYLSQAQLALLGELTVILGLVDDEMVKLVGELLRVSRSTANTIMGSSRIADNSQIWAAVIHERTPDENLRSLVQHAQSEIQGISEGRNDFIHAVFDVNVLTFAGDALTFNGEALTLGPLSARRVKKDKAARSVEELRPIRDRAARLSCLVTHISHVALGKPPETSPWFERLSSLFPHRSDEDKAHKARGPRPRRGSP